MSRAAEIGKVAPASDQKAVLDAQRPAAREGQRPQSLVDVDSQQQQVSTLVVPRWPESRAEDRLALLTVDDLDPKRVGGAGARWRRQVRRRHDASVREQDRFMKIDFFRWIDRREERRLTSGRGTR